MFTWLQNIDVAKEKLCLVTRCRRLLKTNGWCLFAQGLNHFLPLETWNDDMASHPTICLNCVDRNVICVKRKLPSRKHGCPCLYYANSDATFHLELTGDLVFKLNPGPLSRSIPTIVSRHESFRNNKGIWRRNPRNLISVQPNRLQSSFSKLFCHCVYGMPDLLETKQRWLWTTCVT